MDNKKLLEENRIIHYLIAEFNNAPNEAAEEWKNWGTVIDQERVSFILREIFIGMLVEEKKCTEFESKKYIDNLIKEHRKMKTSEIKAGSKQRIKIGKNEVEVTVVEQTAKGWLVESGSGKKFPVKESRFIKEEKTKEKVEPKARDKITTKEAVAPKGKMSMLDAAAEVLKGASLPMSAKELIVAMEKAELWKSPGGKTPHCTISAAIGREILKKENPRFQKAEKGKFELAERNQ